MSFSLYRHISPSGKVYIGITSQPVEHRWNHGKGYMNAKKSLFRSTIIKYGWDNIKHEVLFSELSEERAKHLEVELIRHYKNLGISLNCTDGGEGSVGCVPWNKGIKVPYEQSNKRKGVHLTEEHKRKLSESHKGKHFEGRKWTSSQREKLTALRLGTPRTDEERRKISESSAQAKKVLEYNLSGEIIHIFKSAVEAAKNYNLDSSCVSRCCRNKLLCQGHIFLYADDIVDISKVRYGRYRAGNSIAIRNIKTGEEKIFHSEQACARYLGFKNSSTLRKAVDKGYLLREEWQVVSRNGKKISSKSSGKTKSKK